MIFLLWLLFGGSQHSDSAVLPTTFPRSDLLVNGNGHAAVEKDKTVHGQETDRKESVRPRRRGRRRRPRKGSLASAKKIQFDEKGKKEEKRPSLLSDFKKKRILVEKSLVPAPETTLEETTVEATTATSEEQEETTESTTRSTEITTSEKVTTIPEIEKEESTTKLVKAKYSKLTHEAKVGDEKETKVEDEKETKVEDEKETTEEMTEETPVASEKSDSEILKEKHAEIRKQIEAKNAEKEERKVAEEAEQEDFASDPSDRGKANLIQILRAKDELSMSKNVKQKAKNSIEDWDRKTPPRVTTESPLQAHREETTRLKLTREPNAAREFQRGKKREKEALKGNQEDSQAELETARKLEEKAEKLEDERNRLQRQLDQMKQKGKRKMQNTLDELKVEVDTRHKSSRERRVEIENKISSQMGDMFDWRLQIKEAGKTRRPEEERPKIEVINFEKREIPRKKRARQPTTTPLYESAEEEEEEEEANRNFHYKKQQAVKQRARATPKPKTNEDVRAEGEAKLQKVQAESAFQKQREKDRLDAYRIELARKHESARKELMGRVATADVNFEAAQNMRLSVSKKNRNLDGDHHLEQA